MAPRRKLEKLPTAAAGILVSMMAVIVSIAALVVSCRATDIAELQSRLAEQQLRPFIAARARLQYDVRRRFFDSELVEVTNEGGPLRNFNVDDVVLLEVQYGRVRAVTGPERRLVVLDHYFTGTAHSGAPKGLLATLSGGSNNARYVTLDRATIQYGKNNDVYLFPQLRTLLRITYDDQLGKKHTEYLEVSTVTGSKTLPRRSAERLFALEGDPSHPRIDLLTEPTPEDLVRAWREAS